MAVAWGAAVAFVGWLGAGSTAATIVSSAIVAAASAAGSAAIKQNNEVKAEGNLLDLTLDAAAPRRLVIGKHVVGGTLVDWYASGDNNTKLHMVTYLSEGPCGQVTKVIAGGREVFTTPLVHGVKTPIPEFKDPSNDNVLLHLTYYDGRVGQTANPDLVALGQGWTTDNKMAGCAYIVAEFSWTSQEMSAPPALQYEMEGAKLYDRRKDTTAGGSGSHRHNLPNTWELSDNPMVALDHYMLGRYYAGVRVFGMDLSADEVPYDRFAAQANLCDENVLTLSGGTQKRYRANGAIWAHIDFATTIKSLCTAMAARPADFGGRIGVIGPESKTPVLTIDDGDLIDAASEVYTPKRTWAQLVGAVEGRYKDPNSLYQEVDYPRVSDAAWETEDGGEPRVETLDFEFETDVERAQRLALLYARRERRQATLTGVYPPFALELETGDWFVRTGDRWGIDGKTFEVLTRVYNAKTMTVSITAQEVDPSDSAWDEDFAQPAPSVPVANTTPAKQFPFVVTAGGYEVPWTKVNGRPDSVYDLDADFADAFDTAQDAIIAANLAISELEDTVDDLETDANTLIDAVEARLDVVEPIVSTHTSSISTLTTATNNNATSAAQLVVRADNVDNSITAIQNVNSSQTTQLNSHDSNLNDPSTGLNAKASSLESRVTSVENNKANASDLSNLSTAVGDVEADVTTLQSLTSDLENNKADASALSTLSSTVGGNSSLITALQNTTTSLEQSQSILSTSVNASISVIPASTSNRIHYSKFEGGTNKWYRSTDGLSTTGALFTGTVNNIEYIGFDFTAVGSGKVEIQQDNEYFNSNGYSGFDVTAGERICVQVGLRCSGATLTRVLLRVYYFNADNTSFSVGTISTTDSATLAGFSIFNRKFGGFLTVPSGTSKAIIQVTCEISGASDGKIRVSEPLVMSAHADQTEIPSFVAGPNAENGADVTENSAAYTSLVSTVTAANSANATAINTLNTTTGQNTSKVNTLTSALTASNSSRALFAFEADSGGNAVSIKGIAVSAGGVPTVSKLVFSADQVQIGSATTGARQIMYDNKTEIYDASNNLIVEIGVLS